MEGWPVRVAPQPAGGLFGIDWWNEVQCVYLSRNIGEVTPKCYYSKNKHVYDQSIPKLRTNRWHVRVEHQPAGRSVAVLANTSVRSP